MDKEIVEATRDGRRFDEFLDEAVARGTVAPFHAELVRQETLQLMRRLGYIDKDDRPADAMGSERLTFLKVAAALGRRKLLEFHPELEDELDRRIAHRPYHPLPPVPPELAPPGAAYRAYRRLTDYIDGKRTQGVITRDEAYDILEPIHTLFDDSGVALEDLRKPSTPPAALVQARRLVMDNLEKLRPDLIEEFRTRESGRSR